MNILQVLFELYNHLPENSPYWMIAKNIIENLEEAAAANIYDLEIIVSASRTTIWRFIKLLGYENYSEFHHVLKSAVNNYTYYNRIMPSISEDESAIKDYCIQSSQMISDWFENEFRLDQIEKLAQIINDSNKVFFFTFYQTLSLLSFQQNLAMAGKETAIKCLLPEALEWTARADEKTFVICDFLELSETLDYTPLFMKLKAAGATIAYLVRDTRYSKYIDHYLFETRVGRQHIFAAVTRGEYLIYILSEYYRKKYLLR